ANSKEAADEGPTRKRPMSKGARSHFSEASFGSLDELNSAAPEPSRKNRRKSSKGVVGGILGKMSAPNNVTSGPSAAATDNRNRNVWANHIKNGDDRTHVPPMGRKVFIIRIVQLVLAVVFLVLAAFAAFTLNMGNVSVSIIFRLLLDRGLFPVARRVDTLLSRSLSLDRPYVSARHTPPSPYSSAATPRPPFTRVIEGLTNVFWLATWASLASLASALNVARAGYYYVLAARQTPGPGAYQPQPPPPPPPHEIGVPPDGGRGPGGAGAGADAGASSAAAAATARSTIQAAKVAICVDAGLGALIWVLFVITLIATSESFPSLYLAYLTFPAYLCASLLPPPSLPYRLTAPTDTTRRHVHYKPPEEQQGRQEGQRAGGSGGVGNV
ncbi:hypothetical protein PG997_006894, partial [Apiospora hydei]